MQKLVTGTNVNKGFTLIELLVVIVIIGITLGFALISFGDFGESRKIIYAAEQLEKNIRLAQQQAILESSTLGLRIDNNGYQLLKLQNTTHWVALPSKSLFKMHYFPKGTYITLKTSFKTNKNEPAIVINSSGETNSFMVHFGINKEKTIAVLTGKSNNELSVTTIKK